MKFNFSFKLGKSSISDSKSLFQKISVLWQKLHVLVFFAFFIVLVVVGIYIWQKSIFGSNWSDEKKQDYMNTQSKRVIFKESEFKRVKEDIEARKGESEKPYQEIKDIFKPYQ